MTLRNNGAHRWTHLFAIRVVQKAGIVRHGLVRQYLDQLSAV